MQQVTAGVCSGPQWAVLIDTYARGNTGNKSLSRRILSFLSANIVNTHLCHHAWGNVFSRTQPLSVMTLQSRVMLSRAKLPLTKRQKTNRSLEVSIRNFQLLFRRLLFLRIGKKIPQKDFPLPDISAIAFRCSLKTKEFFSVVMPLCLFLISLAVILMF